MRQLWRAVARAVCGRFLEAGEQCARRLLPSRSLWSQVAALALKSCNIDGPLVFLQISFDFVILFFIFILNEASLKSIQKIYIVNSQLEHNSYFIATDSTEYTRLD